MYHVLLYTMYMYNVPVSLESFGVSCLVPLNLSRKTWFHTSTPSHHSSPSPTPHSDEAGGNGLARWRQLDRLAWRDTSNNTQHAVLAETPLITRTHTQGDASKWVIIKKSFCESAKEIYDRQSSRHQFKDVWVTLPIIGAYSNALSYEGYLREPR